MTAPTLTTPKPILFAGPLAREVRAGRKTQTRRLPRVSPDAFMACSPDGFGWLTGWHTDARNEEMAGRTRRALGMHPVGTVLWVRETVALCVPGPARFAEGGYTPGSPVEVVYLADGERRTLTPAPGWRVPGNAYKNLPVPSIHMARWMACTFLRVTAVRLERLQSITGDDIRAEGLPGAFPLRRGETLREAWQRGWDSISGARHTDARPARWDANPWVVAYTFERVEPLQAGQRVCYVGTDGLPAGAGTLCVVGGHLCVAWEPQMAGPQYAAGVDPFTGQLLGYDCDIGRVEVCDGGG